MKKLLVTLLCVGGLIGLPGCGGCRQSCQAPCDRDEGCGEYYEDGGVSRTCYDGQEVIVYEGQRQPMTKKGKKAAQPTTKKTYVPLHSGAVSGSEVRFMDKNIEEHITEPMPASNARRSYSKEMMDMDLDD